MFIGKSRATVPVGPHPVIVVYLEYEKTLVNSTFCLILTIPV